MVSKWLIPSLVCVVAIAAAVIRPWTGAPEASDSNPRGSGERPVKPVVPWTKRSDNVALTGNENIPATAQSAARERMIGILQSNVPELNEDQLARYLDLQVRSANSLVVVGHLTRDIKFLREAVAANPNDKASLLELALQGREPGEHKQAINAFLMVVNFAAGRGVWRGGGIGEDLGASRSTNTVTLMTVAVDAQCGAVGATRDTLAASDWQRCSNSLSSFPHQLYSDQQKRDQRPHNQEHLWALYQCVRDRHRDSQGEECRRKECQWPKRVIPP